MANLNFSSDYMDSLGPLGAMWLGEQFRTDQNTANINQDNTLESIAKNQQDRDIAKQKLPYELSQLEHQQKMNPLLLEQQGTKNKSDLQKLNKDQFDNFFGQFKDVVPTLQGTPADAAVLGELARKNGMDPADPRIGRMIATATSGNKAAIDDMMKRIALLSEKSIAERKKQEEMDAAHMARTQLEQKSAGERNAATIAGATERARIAAKAKADANQAKKSIEELAKGDPVRTHTLLVQEAQKALNLGDADKANELWAMANEPTLMAKVANQQAQRAQTTLTTDASGNTSLGTTGGTVPLPKAGPPAPLNPQTPNSVPGIGKIKIGNTEYDLLETLPDGSKRIRDPATGKTGTVK